MNKLGAGPNLTWLVIALAAFIAAVALGASAYSSFYNENHIQTDDTYSGIYNNISANDNGLTSINNKFSANGGSILTSVISGIGFSLNAFMVGFGAITTLLVIPGMINSIFNTVQSAIGIPIALTWFITFVIGFYFSMKLIQALRGTISSP